MSEDATMGTSDEPASGPADGTTGEPAGERADALRPTELTREQFERLVDQAVDQIPEKLARQVVNVAVVVEDEPPPDAPGLLGLYQGIPLTERGAGSYAGVLPDTITVYRGPLTRMCQTVEQLIEQVTITVVHEIGHYFGIEEHRLHELGWG